MCMMTAVILAVIALVPTLLPLFSVVDRRWVRLCDFPRLQLAILYLLGLGLQWMAADNSWGRIALAGVLALAVL